MIYPWQTNQWQQLQSQKQAQRLPHAILLVGADGLGKLDFAQALAASLLCTSENESEACGQCNACKLIAAATHPDLLYVAPESEGKAIKVDEIRGLCKEFSLTSQFSGYKVAVIADADSMNINASNSLLKTLEEPTASSVLILVSSKPHRLPVTIRSRCQSIDFQVPDAELAEGWLTKQLDGDSRLLLNLAHGSPLLAVKLANEELREQRKGLMTALMGAANNQAITELALGLSKLPSNQLLGWLYDWIADLLKLQQCGNSASLVHLDFQKELGVLAQRSTSQGLYALMDQVIELRKFQSIPLNAQMLWEDLLISWERQLKRA
jgi:DNA polymerase III subunit delta'